MSYDLMVFAPAAAPGDRASFLAWFAQQAEWSEGHSSDDPAVSQPALRAWFFDAIAVFPALNGPYAPRNVEGHVEADADHDAQGDDDADDTRAADYSVGRDVIYVAFAASPRAQPQSPGDSRSG